MLLDQERCYRAVASRDARFDGRFITAVRTTGTLDIERHLAIEAGQRPQMCREHESNHGSV